MSQGVVIKDDSFIEDNLLKSLETPYIVQTLLAAARVKIKNNAVTSITGWQIVYSAFWLTVGLYSASIYQEYYYRKFLQKNLLMYISCSMGTGMHMISYVMCVIMNRFSDRDKNVKIYTMLQKVDRTLQLDKCTYYTNFQYRWNVIVVMMIIIGFFIGYAAHASALVDRPLNTGFFAFCLLSMFMDNILGAAMLYFLAIRARILNAIIKRRIKECRGISKKPKVMTIKKFLFSLVIPKVQDSNTAFPLEKLHESLQELLKTYKVVNELFSFPVFNLTVTMLLWTYIAISASVIGQRTGLYSLTVTVTIAIWDGFFYLQLVASAIINDWFVKEIKKTKLLCIRLISCDYEGPYQKTASAMIKIIHYEPPIFVVYGIFVLDKYLPLGIVGVIASNVLVLVQFII